MKIVFLDALTLGDLPLEEGLSALGDVEIFQFTAPEQTVERVKGAQVVITNKVIIDEKVLRQCPDLKLICIAATGMNNVDLDFAQQRGVEVKNVSGYSRNSVAQSTFAMLLELFSHVSYYDRYVKSGEYARSEIFTHHGPRITELAGKRLGIIGFGNIGSKVAEIAEAFGCEIVYWSSTGTDRHEYYDRLELPELLLTSDIVSVHAPLNEATEGLIGKNELKIMKKSAVLINAGRGGIVDEEALAKALDEGEISGAGLDVFKSEPLKADSPLLCVKEPNRLLMSPHTAWASFEARQELWNKVLGHIREFASR
ncbi:MAG: D-2-hydroxyacid dehydrogenase [Cytophagales bacterium]|nr:D-2-hydroxyacid dehydrogenase [Cytophagales bacterium]